MVNAGAFPERDEEHKKWLEVPADDGEQAVLMQLVDRGFVARVASATGESGFVLTRSGLDSLRFGNIVTSPEPALQPRRDIAIQDMTQFELAMALEEKGFEWRVLPKKPDQRKLLVFTKDSERVWYSAGPRIACEYLMCLLRAEELFTKGIDAIPHTGSQVMYSKLLRGEKVATSVSVVRSEWVVAVSDSRLFLVLMNGERVVAVSDNRLLGCSLFS